MSDNELIAEFMGGKLCSMYVKDVGNILAYEFDNGDDTDRYAIVTLKYQLSWDWLMEVVNKIDRLQLFDSIEYRELSELGIMATMDTVYMYVVEFIKWHNSVSKT